MTPTQKMQKMQTLTRAGMLVVFGVGCAALGAHWGGAPAPAAQVAPGSATRLTAEDRAELRRALAEDVRLAVATVLPPLAVPARAEPAAAVAPAAPAEAAVRPDPSPAHEAAHQVIDDAIAHGAWRPDDAEALRATIPELSPPEAAQVLADLSRAINTGKVQVAMHDRPIL
ncbi:MAG TPA: hypothetical protein VGD37_43265 [Kofleriaceae bacterium]